MGKIKITTDDKNRLKELKKQYRNVKAHGFGVFTASGDNDESILITRDANMILDVFMIIKWADNNVICLGDDNLDIENILVTHDLKRTIRTSSYANTLIKCGEYYLAESEERGVKIVLLDRHLNLICGIEDNTKGLFEFRNARIVGNEFICDCNYLNCINHTRINCRIVANLVTREMRLCND